MHAEYELDGRGSRDRPPAVSYAVISCWMERRCAQGTASNLNATSRRKQCGHIDCAALGQWRPALGALQARRQGRRRQDVRACGGRSGGDVTCGASSPRSLRERQVTRLSPARMLLDRLPASADEPRAKPRETGDARQVAAGRWAGSSIGAAATIDRTAPGWARMCSAACRRGAALGH